MESIERITDAIDIQQYATTIFIELKKDFDTNHHSTLNKWETGVKVTWPDINSL